MTIAFVVLSRNSGRFLPACIASVVDECKGGDELWIVDNGSSDESRRVIEEAAARYPWLLRPVFLPENRGTTVSRNLALRQTTADFVAIVDSDVTIPSGATASLIRALEADRSVGLVAPRLVYPSGRPQISVDRFPTLSHKLRRYMFLRSMERQQADAAGEERFVDYAISAFWVFRRGLLKEIGFLDERIFYAPEDVDMCLRIWLAGYKVLYQPAVSAVHHAQEVSRGWPFNPMFVRHVGGLAYFFWKHGYAFGRRRLYRRIRRRTVRQDATV